MYFPLTRTEKETARERERESEREREREFLLQPSEIKKKCKEEQLDEQSGKKKPILQPLLSNAVTCYEK
jgi:hypothetical protein